MVNQTILEWLGPLIPLKCLDKHHKRTVCCGNTIVAYTLNSDTPMA